MKKGLLFFLAIFIMAYGCSQPQQSEPPREKVTDKGDYVNAPAGNAASYSYSSLEEGIDRILNSDGGMDITHYNEILAAINELERKGLDVSALREKLARIRIVEEGQPPKEDNADEPPQEEFKRGLLSPRGCEGSGPRMLSSPPMALENTQKILPMGMVSAVHITPTDHQYWHTIGYSGPTDDKSNLDKFEILAPADGYIVELGRIAGFDDYRIIIEHSCNFYTIFIHVDKLSEKVRSSVREEDGDVDTQAWPRIPVKAGEAIGTIGIGKVDFSVVDESVVLSGFVKKETYDGEVWKIHTVDTFDYYEEPLRGQLLAKNLRKAEPFGGKIDYDIDGRLVGNWFLDGTGGYRGLGNVNYWTSHLSVAYDALDPNQIVVSVGDFDDGEAGIFGVRGNMPDPKDVGIEAGIAEYELVMYDYYSNGKKWDWLYYADDLEARNTDDLRGVALFQLLSDGKLKAEFFPGKDSSQVSGFTANALVYER